MSADNVVDLNLYRKLRGLPTYEGPQGPWQVAVVPQPNAVVVRIAAAGGTALQAAFSPRDAAQLSLMFADAARDAAKGLVTQ